MSASMFRFRTDSGRLKAAKYNPILSALEIEFKTGESLRFLGVPETVFRDLTAATLPGRYFAQHVRRGYPHRKVRP